MILTMMQIAQSTPLNSEYKVNNQRDEQVDNVDDSLHSRLEGVVEDIDHDMLVLDNVNSHSPERSEGKECDVELRQLFPALGEEVTHDNSEDDHHCKKCKCDYTDVEIHGEDLFPKFFQFFHNYSPLEKNSAPE